MSTVSRGRYITLDGMRGIAAITVASYHFNTSLTPSGYLSVDLFFILSGFVIAIAYSDRLRAGESLIGFFQARFVRLFPLFLAGIFLGLIHSLEILARGGNHDVGIGKLFHSVLFGVLMAPDPFDIFLYPINGVFWSILCEIGVNVAFATVLIRIPKAALWCVTLLSGVVLYLASNRIASVNGGATWDTMDVGFMRAVFSFSVGMIIADFAGKMERSKSYLAFVLILYLVLLTNISLITNYQLAFDFSAIFFTLPMLLFIGTKVEPPVWAERPFCFLGDISYALYATHYPISIMTISVVKHFNIRYLIALPFFLIITITVAAILTHFWDQPVRIYINRRLSRRPSAIPQTN